MRALLMSPDRDFAPEEHPLGHEDDLTRDLGLDVVLRAMARDDPLLAAVARSALLTGSANDLQTIRYRQEIMQDCLRYPSLVRELYAVATEATTLRRWTSWRYVSHYPGGALYDAIDTLGTFRGVLHRLRAFADAHAAQFTSGGLRRLMATFQRELDDTFFAELAQHLTALRFKQGVLVTAGLGEGNESIDYVLHQPRHARSSWLSRVLGTQASGVTIRIPERDQAGAAALSELRDRGIVQAANIAAEAAEHVLSFFQMLLTELAFYVACLNLNDALEALNVATSLPRPEEREARTLHFGALRDVSLALAAGHPVMGNSLDLDGKRLVVITGANQGGKSSCLRSVGLAQMMMQCGMFVGAEHFAGSLCSGVFTHYTRQEDASMRSGKLDEELSRLSAVIDAITPGAILLFNESFAATNDREGSEIARQVTRALVDRGIRVFFVTHLYQFSHVLYERRRGDEIFLRAERASDGTRTYRIVPGEPLTTSYGADLYEAIFRSVPAPP